MKNRIRFAAISIITLNMFANAAGAANPVAGKGIVLQGNSKGATPCVVCHGEQGAGNAVALLPRLARLDADYLAKQLRDFQRGTRKDAVMQPIAKALSQAEIANVTAYFAAQSLPVSAAAADPALLARGARLATSGFWDKDVPACISCHGPVGRGVGANFPALAGQHPSYIAQQLNAWRTGTRDNDPQGLMKGIALRLPAGDIAAVSVYFSSLTSEP